MPSIEFNRYDLQDLVGKNLGREELETNLTDIGVEPEEIEEDRVQVEVTSDRNDLLSVEGIARNIKSYIGKERGLKKYRKEKKGLKFEDTGVESRPEVVVAAVTGVDLKKEALESIIQLQEKLHMTYGRKRKKVSIGVHDMENIAFPLSYRGVEPDSTQFIPLGREKKMNLEQILEEHEKGKEYGHIIKEEEKYPVIFDSRGNVLSFPPVINGVMTEVTEDTENLFIDVTGTDREAVENALNIIVTCLKERGGTIQEIEVERPDGKVENLPDLSPKKMDVDFESIAGTVGIEPDRKEIKKCLEKMGYGVKVKKGKVLIPPYRSEMLHQVDVAEDLAIGYGYRNLEPEIPNISTIGEEDPLEKYNHISREIMIGLGYQEIMNPTISNPEILLEKMNRKTKRIVKIKNPVSKKYNAGRDMLIPQLLKTLSRNTHNSYPQKIFESADVVMKDSSLPKKAGTRKHLGAVEAAQETDFNSIRADLEGLLESLGLEAELEKIKRPFFIPGRSAIIKIDDEKVGFIGEIHPEVLESHDLEIPAAGFELNLEKLKKFD